MERERERETEVGDKQRDKGTEMRKQSTQICVRSVSLVQHAGEKPLQ